MRANLLTNCERALSSLSNTHTHRPTNNPLAQLRQEEKNPRKYSVVRYHGGGYNEPHLLAMKEQKPIEEEEEEDLEFLAEREALKFWSAISSSGCNGDQWG